MPQLFSTKLEAVKTLTSSVKEFTFALPENMKLSFVFIPGQFIRLFIPNSENKPLTRSYSLANHKRDPSGRLTLAASYVEGGVASEYLFNQIKIGDDVRTSGPFGKLVIKPEDTASRVFLVSTGTGVTPYRAMLPILENRYSTTEYHILQGVRHASDLLYADDFEKSASQSNGSLTFYPCLSREDNTTSDYFRGYVQDQLSLLNPNPESDLIYLCGNPNMIDNTFEMLQTLGFDGQNVRREKYISP